MVKKDVMYQYIVTEMGKPEWYSAFIKFWWLRELSQWIMLGSAVGLSAYILYLCFQGMAKERSEKRNSSNTSATV